MELGQFAFGHPARITARIRLGNGEVIDIEREVELGGPIHSKGVLILSSFLGAHYAPDHPLSLSASLVFEQSYGAVEGDSASSAELYALLSALSGLPVQQSLAVTGLGEPARGGAGHRRRQREDRGVLRSLQRARPARRTGRSDPRLQCPAPDAAPGRRGSRPEREIPHLCGHERLTRESKF